MTTLNKYFSLFFLISLTSCSSLKQPQSLENDDLYFNSQDRVALNKATQALNEKKQADEKKLVIQKTAIVQNITSNPDAVGTSGNGSDTYYDPQYKLKVPQRTRQHDRFGYDDYDRALQQNWRRSSNYNLYASSYGYTRSRFKIGYNIGNPYSTYYPYAYNPYAYNAYDNFYTPYGYTPFYNRQGRPYATELINSASHRPRAVRNTSQSPNTTTGRSRVRVQPEKNATTVNLGKNRTRPNRTRASQTPKNSRTSRPAQRTSTQRSERPTNSNRTSTTQRTQTRTRTRTR